jgi:hypothetical protein
MKNPKISFGFFIGPSWAIFVKPIPLPPSRRRSSEVPVFLGGKGKK